MYDSLYDYISSKVRISDEEFEQVKEAFTPKKLRKRQYLLQEGDVCRYAAFVVKGALRQYLVDEKGNEHITQFAIEDWWISDRESMASETPSNYNIDALEDCELLLLTRQNALDLEKNVPVYKELMDVVKERSAFTGQKRVVSALSYSAEEKYKEFINTYPKIVQRVPQHMIASFLGITPETLSRLRGKSTKS